MKLKISHKKKQMQKKKPERCLREQLSLSSEGNLNLF